MAPEVFEAQQNGRNVFGQQWLALEMVDQRQVFVRRRFRRHRDMGRMVEAVEDHLAIVRQTPALDVVFPDHLLGVEAPAGHEKPVPVDKILVQKSVDEGKIAVAAAHRENPLAPPGRALVVALALAGVGEPVVGEIEPPLIGRLLDGVKEAHAQGVGIDPDAGQGRDPGVDPGKVDLVAADALILEKKGFVPVAGPSLVHDLGADLGLKEEGRLAHDLQDLLHPAVFIAVEDARMGAQKLDQILASGGRVLAETVVEGRELGIFFFHCQKERLDAGLAVVAPALIEPLDFPQVFRG